MHRWGYSQWGIQLNQIPVEVLDSEERNDGRQVGGVYDWEMPLLPWEGICWALNHFSYRIINSEQAEIKDILRHIWLHTSFLGRSFKMHSSQTKKWSMRGKYRIQKAEEETRSAVLERIKWTVSRNKHNIVNQLHVIKN